MIVNCLRMYLGESNMYEDIYEASNIQEYTNKSMLGNFWGCSKNNKPMCVCYTFLIVDYTISEIVDKKTTIKFQMICQLLKGKN